MLGRLLLGAVLGAVVLFVWGFLFWVVLPFSENVVVPLASEEPVAQALKENAGVSGVYYFPAPAAGEEQMAEAFVKRHKAGPIAQIFYRKEGADPTDPMYYLRGFVYFFVSALLAGFLMTKALPQLESYGSRVVFLVVAALFATVFVGFSGAVWWYHTWGYHLYYSLFHLSGWLFAGLAMAAVIKPQ